MRLSAAVQLKASPDDSGIFEGLASPFGGPADAYGDVIARGAFLKTLETHKQQQTAPALLWAHDATAPIGVWRELEESYAGLWVKGKITLGTAKGAEAYALMKDGALGLSIGYVPKDWTMRDDGARELRAIDLVEISTVAVPANPLAKIQAVKSALCADRRSFEHAVRDVLGLSAREAKRLAADGWRGLTTPDAAGCLNDQALERMAATIKSTITKLRS